MMNYFNNVKKYKIKEISIFVITNFYNKINNLQMINKKILLNNYLNY